MTSPFKAKFERLFTCAAALGLLAASGCASFKLKDPPPGFIEVSSSKHNGEAELRMKAPDNVGLNITSFSNRRGGNLALVPRGLARRQARPRARRVRGLAARGLPRRHRLLDGSAAR